nr:U32 family peptidase [uncultured Acetatifactor sp.]
MENRHKVELLAPAGNPEGFYGAVHAGADAVYLAGDRFGARAYAQNFTEQELTECIRYGHLLGRKIYLTVNTLLKEPEISGLYDYLAPLCQAGLDAVIVQDLGVLRFLREHFPGLKIHASTQMTVCDGFGASLLKELGACRVVPARELSLAELTAMKRRAGIEIEAFIHGAMCYCYSGQCLFSSILGGRSGNRGRCAQPCRLPYAVSAGGGKREECHPLSLKDMCTVAHIPELIEAGIDSFKIEGRMKKPEYAAGVTDVYRRYIDRYWELRRRMGVREAAEAYHVERRDLEALSSLYVRSGLQDGYFFRRNGREMVTLDSPAYRESNEELLSKIRAEHIGNPSKLPVAVSAVFRLGQPAEVTFCWEDMSASVQGAPVEAARQQPVTEENVRKQLCKLGDSAFYAAETEIVLDQGCFYPLKQINELRRAAVAELEEKVLRVRGYEPGHGSTKSPMKSPEHGQPPCTGHGNGNAASGSHGYAFYVRTIQQLEALCGWLSAEALQQPVRIYVDSDLLLPEQSGEPSGQAPNALSLCERLAAGSKAAALYAALPYILREADRRYLEELSRIVEACGLFQGFLARSMDGLGFVRENHRDMSCRTDAGIYIWNHSAAEELSALSDGFCLPYELKAAEQRNLLRGLADKGLPEAQLPCEKMVYGRIPMMITANCLKRTIGQCGANRRPKGQPPLSDAVLTDRYRKEFPVVANCRHCMNIIYNSVPLSLHQSLSALRGDMDLRMDFTIEPPAQVKGLLDCFLKGAPFLPGEYTTGHEKRGVE